MKKKLMLLAVVAGLLSYGANVSAAKTVLAGGCFWCMESDFEKLEGVSEVVSGFTGGTMAIIKAITKRLRLPTILRK